MNRSDVSNPMLKLMSHIAFPVFLASLVTLALRGSLISTSPGIVVCQALALALMLWARRSFPSGSFRFGPKPAGSTVLRRGPYRFMRHPMYAGALLLLWSSIAGHFSIANACIGLIVLGFILVKIAREERLLKSSLTGYAEYARSTKALIPFVL